MQNRYGQKAVFSCKPQPQRNQEIYSRYLAGETQTAIARDESISRERVKQIVYRQARQREHKERF